MAECLISCPPCRPLGPAVIGRRVERVTSRIGEDGTFSYRVEGGSHGEGGTFPLPKLPHHGCRWGLAITIPFRVGQERGLAFFLGGLRCFWSFASSRSLGWEPVSGLGSERMALVAMSTDPSPFMRFCEELLLASRMHSGVPIPIPPGDWPRGLHTHWFSVLLGTSCVDPSSPSPPPIAHWVPSPRVRVSSLVRDLRVGAVVSAAWRTPSELPLLLASLSRHASVDEEAIDWQSLPTLCSE